MKAGSSLAALTLGLLAQMALAAPGLTIREGHVREMPPGQTVSAAFMTLQNDSAQPIALVAASSDAADRVEIHTHQHGPDGMRMEKVVRLAVPAKSAQVLQPGGYHLMLFGLKRPLKAGENVGITLIDEQGRNYPATLPVKRLETGGHAHH